MCRSTKPKKCITVIQAGILITYTAMKWVETLRPSLQSQTGEGVIPQLGLRSGPQCHQTLIDTQPQSSVSDLWVEEIAAVSTAVRSGQASNREAWWPFCTCCMGVKLQKEEQNILQCTNSVCLVCLLNFTFLARCILSRVIAVAYVSKEQETDCQRPSQDISKINKHNMHIRWSECQYWDKLNLQRKCHRNFPLNHTKL